MQALTGQQVVNAALTILGINEQGGNPSTSDSTDTLAELNAMWDAWSVDEGFIYQEQTIRFPWGANVAAQSIGVAQTVGSVAYPAGNINQPAPSRVYRARVTIVTGGAISVSAVANGGTGYAASDTGVVLGAQGTLETYTVNTVSAGAVATYTLGGVGTGYQDSYDVATATAGAQPGAGVGFTINITTVSTPTQIRVQLEVVSASRYYSHRDLSASAKTPDEIFPDLTPSIAGVQHLYLYPVPSAAINVELECGIVFATWTLTGAYFVPAGMLDALQYALAFRCLPRFGAAVAKEVAETVMALGEKAEARLRDMVAKNRQVPAADVAPSGDQAQPAGGQ